MLLGASLVWRVDKTRCPVRADCMAISAVSRSLISPIMMISGSCLTICLKVLAKLRPIWGLTCIWLMPFNWYSMGSSTVMIILSGEFILSRAP
jgi:hypothetical protein